MTQNGYIFLNGRTKGDERGLFTFSNKNGDSTMDFIWIKLSSIDIVDNFTVCIVPLLSDHFPIITTLILIFLSDDHIIESHAKKNIVISDWNTEKVIEYQSELMLKYGDISLNDFFN